MEKTKLKDSHEVEILEEEDQNPRAGRVSGKKVLTELRSMVAEDRYYEPLAASLKEEYLAYIDEHLAYKYLASLTFCAGWLVAVYRQNCGHLEILQTPVYEGLTKKAAYLEMVEESSRRSCTSCILGSNK